MIISICCNDPANGSFTGRLLCVDYASMELCYNNWYNGRGCSVSFKGDDRVRISRRLFTYAERKIWYGNWCWDALTMERKEARRLLRYLHDSGCWACESGPTRLYEWFNAPKRQPIVSQTCSPAASASSI